MSERTSPFSPAQEKIMAETPPRYEIWAVVDKKGEMTIAEACIARNAERDIRLVQPLTLGTLVHSSKPVKGEAIE